VCVCVCVCVCVYVCLCACVCMCVCKIVCLLCVRENLYACVCSVSAHTAASEKRDTDLRPLLPSHLVLPTEMKGGRG
jgi:hypothetical protein